MQRIFSSDGPSVFHLSAHEKELFLKVLELYPLIPDGHSRLSKTEAPALEEAQRLLDEALAEQRQTNRRQLDAMLASPQRFTAQRRGFRLRLASSEIEQLLQILNDIRVGCWLLLGSPEEPKRQRMLGDPKKMPYIVVMDLCGHFQSALLQE